MGIKLNHINQKVAIASRQEPKSTTGIFEFLTRDISFNKKYPDKKKEQFYGEISLLLNAGTDIKTALELIVEETEKAKDKRLLEQIKDDIINGMSFSEALEKTQQFSDYEFYSLKVGEESSRVHEVLADLASFFKNKVEQKRKLTSTLSYPVILLSTAILMVLFLLKYMVPMFQDIFKSFNKELPGITQFVVDASDAVSDYFLIFVLTLIGLVGFILINKRKLWFRKISSAILLKVPIIGELVQKIYLTRFCHSMSLLITARNPLLNSVQLVKKND